MNHRYGLLLVALLGITAFGACNKDPATPTILEASAAPYVSDLPVPVKFRIAERQSEDKSVPGRRSVKHVYQGPSEPLAVKNFYRHYMPLSTWELLEESSDKGVYLLKLRKGPELCEIRIERMPTEKGTVTQVLATIHSMMDSPG
jgi:hypothetical protein